MPASRPRLARTWASEHEDQMPPSLLGPVSWRPVWELLPPPVLAGASCRSSGTGSPPGCPQGAPQMAGVQGLINPRQSFLAVLEAGRPSVC